MVLASFGLYDIIGIVMAIFMIVVCVMEIRSKKSGDLFTNIVIAVIGAGASIFTFYNNLKDVGYKFAEIFKMPTTYFYLVSLLAAIAFTALFVVNYLKHKDDPTEENKEEAPVEEPLSNEQIEEILEKENVEVEDNKKNSTDESENNEKIDNLINEETKPMKEGATQVPKEQRNPFDK